MSDDWNNTIANQAVRTLWVKHSHAEEIRKERHAVIDALIGIAPRDELEGMIGAQLIACHNASMERYRRAMLGEQSLAGARTFLRRTGFREPMPRCWKRSIVTAAKASRRLLWSTSTSIRAAKPSSAQSRARGEGIARNQRINPMQSKSPMHLSPRCGARTRSASRCQSPAMPNGRCRMHGGMSPGAPKGNSNAFKHGRYTAEAICNRRKIKALLRGMKALASERSAAN